MAAQNHAGELRINPEDGKSYTLDSFLDLHRGTFDDATIHEFWNDLELANAEEAVMGYWGDLTDSAGQDEADGDAQPWSRGNGEHSQRNSRSRSPVAHSSGFKGMGKQDSPHATMARLFNEALQNSQPFSKAWQEYAGSFGGGRYDPHAQSEDFMSAFFEYSSDCAVRGMEQSKGGAKGGAQMGFKAPIASQMFGPPTGPAYGESYNYGKGKGGMDRQAIRDAASRAVRDVNSGARRSGTTRLGDGSKEALVQKIKDWQRRGEAQKQQWWAYADANFRESTGKERTKDPNRFEEEALQRFLMMIDY